MSFFYSWESRWTPYEFFHGSENYMHEGGRDAMSQNNNTTKKKKSAFNAGQVIIASMGFGACLAFWSIYNTYVPLILDYKLSNLGNVVLSTTVISTLTGFIMTIDNMFGLIFQPMFGRKSDYTRSRWGKRMPYLIVGIPLCALLFILIPIMGSVDGLAGILAMMVVVIIFNFVMSTWRAPCVAIMPDMVPIEYQSDGNAIVNIASGAVSVLASLSATILGAMGFKEAIEEGDYKSVFVFGALLAVLCLVIIWIFVKWPDNRNEEIVKEESAEGGEKKSSLLHPNLPADVKRSMYIMMFSLFFISGTNDGFSTYTSLYASKLLDIGVARITLLSTLAAVGGAVLALPAGVLGRKLGRRKTIILGLGLVAVCYLLMFLMPYMGLQSYDLMFTVLSLVKVGAFLLVNINTLPIMLAIGGKERFGEFTGFYYFATFSAAVVCPTLIGWLIGVTNSYNALPMFCLIGCIIGVIGVANVKHGDKMSAEDEEALAKAVQEAED